MPETGPTVESSITLHTLWQALTGALPPLALRPLPLPHATLDSRAVAPESLFVAQPGQKTDGHHYIGAALQAGARCHYLRSAGRAACDRRRRHHRGLHGARQVRRFAGFPPTRCGGSPLRLRRSECHRRPAGRGWVPAFASDPPRPAYHRHHRQRRQDQHQGIDRRRHAPPLSHALFARAISTASRGCR